MAGDCPAGQSFDANLSRCITSEQSGQIISAVQNCNGDKECFKRNAENALKEGEAEGKVKAELANSSGLLNTSLKAAAVAVPLAMGMAMLKNVSKHGGTKCAAPSIYAMMGGGVAMVAGDLISNMQHKSRLKKIDEDWAKVKGAETQGEAFEFLARREDSMAKAAQMKTMFYGVGTMAFAASAVMSTIEAVRLDQQNVVCKVHIKTEAELDKEASDYDALHANDAPTPDVDPNAEIVVTARPIVKGLSKLLLMPTSRAVISGIFSAWAGTMALHAAKQAKVSKNRAEFLRKMKDEFNVAKGAIAEGSSGSSAAAAKSSAFKLLNGSTIATGPTCISRSGDPDESCNCRKTNTCLSSGLSGITGLSPSTISVLSSGLSPVDQAGNGSLAEGSVSASGASAKAIRLLQAAKKLAASTPKGADLSKKNDELALQVSNDMIKATAGISTPALANSSALPTSLQAASLSLEKEIKNSQAPTTTAVSVGTTSAISPLQNSLEEALTADSQVNEAMKQDLDYGQNDVHDDPQKNIFEVITNRYQQSGKRRLLEAQ